MGVLFFILCYTNIIEPLALTEINGEDNPDKLIAIYDEYTRENDIKIDYLLTAVFNGELKELFVKEFNRAFTPIEQFNILSEDDGTSIVMLELISRYV